jgi:flavin reductase (DIM6/NTAB) family NADH-FMN oxidoreductase RutF
LLTLHENGVLNAGVFGAYTNISPTQIAAAVGTPSDTCRNILREKEFVINIPGADIVKSLKVLAAKLSPEKSEVDEAGLTKRESVVIKTPGIAECAAACEFVFERENRYFQGAGAERFQIPGAFIHAAGRGSQGIGP